MTDEQTPQTWGSNPDPVMPTEPAATPEQAPEPADAKAEASQGTDEPGPGTLCTLATEDEAGFTSLATCLVLEVFTEPDDDGNDVQLARIAVLPDERIAHVGRLRPFVSKHTTESD